MELPFGGFVNLNWRISLQQSTWLYSLWGVSEVPTWHTDGAGMMGGGHFRYSDLKEAGVAEDAYVI